MGYVPHKVRIRGGPDLRVCIEYLTVSDVVSGGQLFGSSTSCGSFFSIDVEPTLCLRSVRVPSIAREVTSLRVLYSDVGGLRVVTNHAPDMPKSGLRGTLRGDCVCLY